MKPAAEASLAVFMIPQPGIISYSGGRTSAMMLHQIIAAFGGALPPDVRVLFCNTGKERIETLEFVHECATRWNVPIIWLEYRYRNGLHSFAVVDYETASRKGEPFEQVIQARNDYRRSVGKAPILPNPIMRFCTAELKIRTKRRYMVSLGFDDHRNGYCNAIGFRADEWKRVYKVTKNCSSSDDCGKPVCPLYDAGVSEVDVMEFWARQPFDLQLQSYEGNCDNCFLKSRKKIQTLAHERPQDLGWWAEQERKTGATFRRDRPTYTEMRQVGAYPLPLFDTDEEDGDCHCTD